MARKGISKAKRETEPRDPVGWQHPALDYSTFRLALVAKAIDRMTLRMLARTCSYSVSEWRVLSRLGTGQAATVRDIADSAWADRAEVSRAAASLERRGLLERRLNPNDRRAPILSCTAEGRKEYERILPERIAFHEALLKPLENWERAALDALLAKLATGIAGLDE